MIKRILLQLTIVCSLTLTVFGQGIPHGSELQEIIRIGEAYRQMPYLSFNATYQFADSANPTATTEQILAQYKIHEGRFWAMLDSTELVQGNNYKLSVYHDQKFIVVGKPDMIYSSMLQLSFLDSLFESSFIDSMQVYAINDSTKKLGVVFRVGAPFTQYEIYYNPVTYMVYSLKYYQKDLEQEEGSSGTSVINVTFGNYSDAIIDDEYFRESKFIYKDGPNFYPKDLFIDFEIIVSAEF